MVGPIKPLPLEMIMRKKKADVLRHHYYTDLNKVATAYPKRIAEILEISPGEASKLIERAREKVNERT